MRRLRALAASAVAVAALLAPSFSHGQDATRNGVWLNLGAIHLISCGRYVGSGTVIGQPRMVTPDHVIADLPGSSCSVDGHAARPIWRDAALDLAVLEVDLPRDEPIAQFSCDSMQKGLPYFAVGYAYGRNFSAALIVPTGERVGVQEMPDGALELRPDDVAATHPHIVKTVGDIHHGMSGGPVVDPFGRVTGVVDMGDGGGEALIREFAGTPICTVFGAPAEPLKPTPQDAVDSILKGGAK